MGGSSCLPLKRLYIAILLKSRNRDDHKIQRDSQTRRWVAKCLRLFPLLKTTPHYIKTLKGLAVMY